jgi:hypothetical protein
MLGMKGVRVVTLCGVQVEERERKKLEKAQRSAEKLATRKDNTGSSTKKKREGERKLLSTASDDQHHSIERVASDEADSEDSGFGDEDHLEALYTPSKEAAEQNSKQSASTPGAGGTPKSAASDTPVAGSSATKKQGVGGGGNELSSVKLRPTGSTTTSPEVTKGVGAEAKTSAGTGRGKGGEESTAAAPAYADPGEIKGLGFRV